METIRRPSCSESERYEVCELVGGDSGAQLRVIAAAETPDAARLARRTLYEEGEAEDGALVIRDTVTGRRLRG